MNKDCLRVRFTRDQAWPDDIQLPPYLRDKILALKNDNMESTSRTITMICQSHFSKNNSFPFDVRKKIIEFATGKYETMRNGKLKPNVSKAVAVICKKYFEVNPISKRSELV